MAKRTPNLDKVVNSIDFYDLREALNQFLDFLDSSPDAEGEGGFAECITDVVSALTVAAAKDGFGSHPTLERFIPCTKQ